VPLAGIMSGNIESPLIKNKRIGIIISGGNIDLSNFFSTLKKNTQKITF